MAPDPASRPGGAGTVATRPLDNPGAKARWINPALAVILALYLALGSVYAMVTPAFEKPDEQWHTAYVRYILDHGGLPPITADAALNPARQEAGQPPLFYLLAAGCSRLFGWQVPAGALPRNPYWGYPALGTVNDNKNRFVHLPGEWGSGSLRGLLWLRLFSVLLGAGGVTAAYGLGRRLGADPRLALAGAALMATLPQYLFIASSTSNDALAATLAGAGLWALAGALRPGARPGDWRLFSALASLAVLTKSSNLILPLFGAALAVLTGMRAHSWRTAASRLLTVVVGLLILAGPWYAHNMLLYGDPLGLQIHFRVMGRTQPLTLAGLVQQVHDVEVTFWAAFGWGNVTLPRAGVHGAARCDGRCRPGAAGNPIGA